MPRGDEEDACCTCTPVRLERLNLMDGFLWLTNSMPAPDACSMLAAQWMWANCDIHSAPGSSCHVNLQELLTPWQH